MSDIWNKVTPIVDLISRILVLAALLMILYLQHEIHENGRTIRVHNKVFEQHNITLQRHDEMLKVLNPHDIKLYRPDEILKGEAK